MPSIVDIHSFYEANLAGYKRADLIQVNKGVLKEMGLPAKKPVNEVLNKFQEFKEFVVFDWMGFNEIRTEKLPPEPIHKRKKTNKKRKEFGKCKCGGEMVKRQNRSDKSYFLGCSRWPKCTNTKPLLP